MKNILNKAFIFDMDGVIVNSEPVWERYEQKFLPELMGENLYLKIKDKILGNTVTRIYEEATKFGFKMAEKDFKQVYDQYGEIVYREAKIADGLNELINELIGLDFKLGLVSASRGVDLVLNRLNDGKNIFQFILSLDREKVKPKPSPYGYLRAIKELGSIPTLSVILEDSDRGIKAAKASGAFTICLKEFLPKDTLPKGADMYTATIRELIKKIPTIKL